MLPKVQRSSRITADLELAGVRVFDPGEKPVCGRYTPAKPRKRPSPRHLTSPNVPELLPRYNIAPTQAVPVVRLDRASGERGWRLLQWGLIPSWADDPAIGNRLINARAETVARNQPSAPYRARDRAPPRRLPFGRMRGLLFPMKPLLRVLEDALFIATGVLSAGMGLPRGPASRAASSTAASPASPCFLAKVLGLPLSALILVINVALPHRPRLPPRSAAKFAIRGAAAIVGLSACLATIHYPDAAPDKLLTTMASQFFIRAGWGWQFTAARSSTARTSPRC